MATGYELVPLLSGGTVARLRDLTSMDQYRTRIPLMRAGKTGHSCTPHDLFNAGLNDTDTIPLLTGGISVTVAVAKNFD